MSLEKHYVKASYIREIAAQWLSLIVLTEQGCWRAKASKMIKGGGK